MSEVNARADRQALEDERDHLFASLDDLDAEYAAGDLDEDDYRALKDDYTARAAAVLRKLERRDRRPSPKGKVRKRPRSAASEERASDGVDDDTGSSAADGGDEATADPAPSARRRRWNWVAAVVGTVAFAALAGWLVTANAGERTAGQSATGSVPQRGGGQAAATPADCATLPPFPRAQCLDKQGKLLDALKAYDEVVAADPNNVMAWSQSGWMLVRTNQPELMQRGIGRIDKALAIDPNFAQAHFFKGAALQRTGRPAEAVCELRIFLGQVPPGGPETKMVEPLLKGATEQAEQKGQPINCPKTPLNPNAGQGADPG